MKTAHTPLELAIRYAAVREHNSRTNELAQAAPTVVRCRRNVTRRIPAATLAALRMESATGAWVDGVREAA